MQRIVLVGIGLVGRAWAIVFARAGFEVVLHDEDAGQLSASRERIASSLADLAAAGLATEPAAAVLDRLTFESRLERALADAVYVQESIGESLEAKQALFARLDALAPPAAILASSTSAFATSLLAGSLPGRHRCLVAHPVNPPYLIPFVEVCGAPFTAEPCLERTAVLLESAGMSPIRVRVEVRGFVLNRLQWTLLAEACRLVAAGVASIEDVDRAVRDGLGRRWAFMGPFEVGDLNAPGGLGDYLQRFRETIEEIDASRRTQVLDLGVTATASLDAARRAVLPEAARSARALWRDRRLMGLAAHLAAADRADRAARTDRSG
jgi:3-hydroxyacyl-CoA dehydrogenase